MRIYRHTKLSDNNVDDDIIIIRHCPCSNFIFDHIPVMKESNTALNVYLQGRGLQILLEQRIVTSRNNAMQI